MTIRNGDTVRFLDNYGDRYWVVLTRGKRRAQLRALGMPDSLVISTDVDNLTFVRTKNREKRR